jgi:hypothetical protein
VLFPVYLLDNGIRIKARMFPANILPIRVKNKPGKIREVALCSPPTLF